MNIYINKATFIFCQKLRQGLQHTNKQVLILDLDINTLATPYIIICVQIYTFYSNNPNFS